MTQQFRPIRVLLLVALSLSMIPVVAWAESPEKLRDLKDDEVSKITEAMPSKAAVAAKKPRKMLVFWRCEGFYHASIPVVNRAMEIMGEKTGAFEVTAVTDDYSVFTKESLKKFDIICLNNTTHLKFDPKETPDRCEALMAFMKSGKGLVGIHAAADNFYKWPEAMEMMGNKFTGHPWGGGGTWAIKIDEPDHPLTAPFKGKGFKIRDEIYRTDPPLYSRKRQHVLMSLDMSDQVTGNAKGLKPTDQDTGISWISTVGKGRVFYTGLGHNNEVLWNAPVLEHILLGVQYAAGDLEVPKP
jgi:uncharacterized protein